MMRKLEGRSRLDQSVGEGKGRGRRVWDTHTRVMMSMLLAIICKGGVANSDGVWMVQHGVALGGEACTESGLA